MAVTLGITEWSGGKQEQASRTRCEDWLSPVCTEQVGGINWEDLMTYWEEREDEGCLWASGKEVITELGNEGFPYRRTLAVRTLKWSWRVGTGCDHPERPLGML
jgi:hypothetical protein